MTDRNKVIEGLEYLITAYAFHCDDAECLGEAVELLKEQEPIPVKIHAGAGSQWYISGCCGYPISPGANYCPECGKKVLWNAEESP